MIKYWVEMVGMRPVFELEDGDMSRINREERPIIYLFRSEADKDADFMGVYEDLGIPLK